MSEALPPGDGAPVEPSEKGVLAWCLAPGFA